MTHESTLEYAQRRDAADPLRAFRDRFALPRDGQGRPLLYLCGHSLGLQPLAAREAIVQELDDWAQLGVLGHEHARRPWIHYHEALTPGLARMTGADPGEVVAMNSLTANLHLMLASFLPAAGTDATDTHRGRRVFFGPARRGVAPRVAWAGSARGADRAGAARRAQTSCRRMRSKRAWSGMAQKSRWCCGRACSSAPGRLSTSRGSCAPRSVLDALQDSTSRIPSATCRSSCTPATPTSQCGAATSI